MSFTDQKRRIATEEECNMSWGGARDNSRFRCYMCGHKFQPGDGWRWQYAGSTTFERSGETFGLTNLAVCDDCDGADLLERWKQKHEEFYSAKYWALI